MQNKQSSKRVVKQPLVIVGTGHRPQKLELNGLDGFSDKVHDTLVKFLKEILSEYPVKCVISGMALGFDQALAEAALQLNISVVAALPCFDQDSLWPVRQQARYKRLIKQCKKVIYVSSKRYDKYCLQRRNKWMVNKLGKVGLLLAFYNGSKGGTHNCIKYATNRKKKIVNVWDKWVEVIAQPVEK